jgi:ABC-type taurine transport system substrate-binding protein
MRKLNDAETLSFNRFFFITVLMCLLLIAFTGCEKNEKAGISDFETHPVYKNYRFSNDEKVIEIGVPTPWASVNHIVEVMKRDRIFKEELKKAGYTVKFYPFLKGEEINYFMKKGLLEGSMIGDMPTIKMASEDGIKAMSVFNRGSVSLVSRDIYRVKDLKGKKVAYPRGSVSHYYLLRLLKEKGMSENDIRQKPMDAPSMLNAIRDGTIDAFTTFEPTATVYTKIDPTLHTIHRSFSGYAFLNIRKDYGEKHNEAVRMIIAAQLRAVMWISESDRNLEKASTWMAEESLKVMPVPLDRYVRELNTIVREDIAGNTGINAAVISEDFLRDGGTLSREFEFLKSKGFIPRGKEWREVARNFDTSTAFEVMKVMKADSARISE